MLVTVKIERDKQTLKRWNFDEEALVIYDRHRHTALPLSKVSGLALRKIVDEWNLPPEAQP